MLGAIQVDEGDAAAEAPLAVPGQVHQVELAARAGLESPEQVGKGGLERQVADHESSVTLGYARS